MELEYRKSTEIDRNKIDTIMHICFGDGYQDISLNEINNRYLLAFDNDKLIAMTGLCESLEYVGKEIDWTCILPEYRGRGIITNMIREVIKDCQDDIYCSCWRLIGDDKVNLDYAMQELGFVCVVKDHKKYDNMYHQVCLGCVKRYDGCKCCEDLYLRNFKKDK